MLELKKFIYSDNQFIVPYLGNISFRKNFSGWYRGKVSQRGRHEFYLITRGKGILTIEKDSYKVSKGDLIYIPALADLRYDLLPDEGLIDYFSINLSCAVTSHVNEIWLYDEGNKYHYQSIPYQENEEWSFIKSEEPFDLPVTHSMSNYTILQNLLSKIYHLRTESDTVNFWTEKNLLQYFLCEITVQNQTPNIEDMNAKRIYKLISYIKKHYMESLTLENLCDLVNLSPSYVICLFNKYTNHSPLSYVNYIRIEFAKEMLSESSSSISEIATLSGYQDVFYFSKKFKKLTGLTPRQYRNSLP